MKRYNLNNTADELSDVMNEMELEELEKELNQYLVKYPDEQEMDATIDTLRQYVPCKQKDTMSQKERLLKLIKRSATEITLISKTYWLASMILFILGYFITSYAIYDPLLTLIIIAPLPFLFGLMEVFKGRDQGVMEMEMTCKFSAHEIMLTRLLLIGVYNLTLNTILTISFVSLIDTVSIWQILLVWFTPLTFFAALSLWLSMKFRGPVFVTMIVSLWMVISISFVSRPSWIDAILNLNIAFYLLFIGIGIFLFILQIKQSIKKYAFYEGVGTVEISY